MLLRVAALETLSGHTKLNQSSFELLSQILRERNSPTRSARAAQLLGSSTLSNEQLMSLSSLLKAAGPLELRELIKPFQRNQNPEVVSAFLASIEKSPGLLSLDPVELSDVIKRYPSEVLEQANSLLAKLEQRDAEKQQRLENLLPTLAHGDAQRGRTVFMSERAKCSSCHRIGEAGGKIGPDLSRIGRIRQSRDLLEAIVIPSSSLVREYEPFNVLTDDDKMITGLITHETDDAIVIQQQIGNPLTIPRGEIDEIVPSILLRKSN